MDAAQLNDRLTRLLRENVFFSILDEDDLQWLTERMQMVTFALGETVITEGDRGDEAYLVLSGRLRVVKRGTSGKPVTLGTASAGDLVGERAIITDEPRSATVRVAEDAVLFRIARDDFTELLEKHPKLRQYFTEHIQERAVVEFLRLATFVGQLPPSEITTLLDQLEACDFPAGETIIREGEAGDRMYIILSGEVKAVHGENGSEKVLSYLGDGEFFGERALILNEPRSASVIATSPTRCFSLSRRHFDDLLDSAPAIRAQLAERIEQYNVSAEQEARFGVRQPARREKRSLAFLAPAHVEPPSQSPSSPPPERAARPRQKLRKPRRLKRYPWIQQHDETDCGAASLAMIAKYHGISVSVGKLRDQASVGREGASLYSLSAAAEQLGFRTRALRADYGSLRQLTLPAIAHWKGYHYVVLYEAGPERVVLGDPALGLVRMSRAEFEAGWTGRLLTLEPTPRLEEVEPEKTTLSRFLPLLKPHRSLLIEIVLASLVLELLQLASPIFTQTIVDKVLVHQNVNMLNIMLGGMVIIGLFQTATIVLRQTLLIHVSQKLELRMASDLFHHIMYLPMRFFHTRHIGDLLKRFKDNDQVQRMLTNQAVATLFDVLMMFTTLALMLYYNVKLTLVALVAIPIYIVLTLIFTPLLRRNNQREFEHEAKTESTLVESVQSIETIKACTAEFSSQWKYEDQIVRTANTEIQGARLAMMMHGSSRAVGIFASTFLLWYGAHLVIQRELTVGQLMAFQALIGMLTAPIMALIAVWTQLQDTALSLKRLNDIYGTEVEQPGDRTAVVLPTLRGSILLEDVNFRYNLDDKNILSGISLEIQPGQTVAIVGRSGSGKSTLIRLLQRYYLPTEGRILVDGYDLASVDLRSYRSQMGVVAQDATIFSGTIRENIAVADPEASMDRIISAAKLAAADDFIRGLPMGYDTVVGSVGVQLSGGQKQRICIARALLTDPRILIFDEATSSLDTESEKLIQQNMKAILLQRTSIIIAHRLSTVQNADLIVVLDDGVIVEKGTHRELMQMRGLYFYLTSQQMAQ